MKPLWIPGSGCGPTVIDVMTVKTPTWQRFFFGIQAEIWRYRSAKGIKWACKVWIYPRFIFKPCVAIAMDFMRDIGSQSGAMETAETMLVMMKKVRCT